MSGKDSLKLHIENFQAISDIDMDFETGINIIVGQSNSGKTSVLRAIDTIVNNSSGSAEFIKKGTARSTLSMLYNNNNITWSRTAKEIEYSINGEKFLKVGKTDLFKLLPNNGFIRDPQGEFSNLEDEWTLPFPFYKNGGEIFKLFENIFSVSDSAKILKCMKEGEDTCKKELASNEKEIAHINLKIDAINKLNIEESVSQLKEHKETLEQIRSELESLYEARNSLYTLKNKLEIEKQLPSTPSIRLDVEEYTELHEELYKIKKLQLGYNTLNKLPKNSIVLDTVLEQLDSVRDIKTDLDKLTQFKQLTHITFPESVKVNNELFNEIRTLHENLETLKYLQTSGKNLVHALREKQELVKELKVELDKVEVCPLCGNSLKECGEEKWL